MFLFLIIAMSKHVIKAQIIPRMSGSILPPNMGTDLKLKRSDFDVPNKKFGMKHQKAPEIKLQTNLAG